MTDPLDPTRVDQPVVPPDPDPTMVGGPPTGRIPTGGAVPPPPDRRPWLIAGLLGLIVVVLILILLFQDDDDDDVDTAASTSTSELTSTSTSTTEGTTTTTEETTTTEAADVTVPPEQCAEAGVSEAKPGLAAETVFDAWVRGDQACAAELMTAPALAELFSRDGEGATDQFLGCTQSDEPGVEADCTYTYEGGATHYLMAFEATNSWKVIDVEQVAD
jgi:cytoskeletal protein RodZ